MSIVWISTDMMTFGLVLNEDRMIIDAAPIAQRYIGAPIRFVYDRFRRKPGFQVAWWCEL